MPTRLVCPFHTDEDLAGTPTGDGVLAFTCDRTNGHPAPGPFSWLHDPVAAEGSNSSGFSGLAEELGLPQDLPVVLAGLGDGWFEYGLVERAYADAHPEEFAIMVEKWGHTAIASAKYTCSSYIAGVLGGLSRLGEIAYHDGRGTGRWSYNSSISYWASEPQPWSTRTTWVDVIGDDSAEARDADAECRRYVGV
ncbi:hypothetical protein [Nocardioides fonticola]